MVVTTALFDLDRTDWPNYNRSIETYKRYGKNILSLKSNMVIYTTEDLKSYFEENRKVADPDLTRTIIVTLKLQDIPYYNYLEKLETLMKTDFFIQNIKNRADIYRPEANYPIYNIIQFAKSKFVETTIKNNFFNSETHCWLDISAYHDIFPQEFLNRTYPSKNEDLLLDGKIHHFYRQHPRDSDANKVWYYGDPDDVRMVGGWFGGTKAAMLKYAEIINKVIDDSISEGVISDDQNIYTIAYLENKELFNLHDGHFAHSPWFSGLDYFL